MITTEDNIEILDTAAPLGQQAEPLTTDPAQVNNVVDSNGEAAKRQDEATANNNEFERLFTFQKARASLNKLVTGWKSEVAETEVRRKTRKVEINVEELRASGDIAEDETFIPMRIINSNIEKEQPPYINYLINSRRLAIFRCKNRPSVDTQQLESEFTKGMTYLSWETPYFKCLDGSMTHGWDAVEITHDESKPLHTGLEHIGHDKLFYPDQCINIQDAPQIVRQYDVSTLRLQEFVDKYGFNKGEVSKYLDRRKNNMRDDEVIPIYKRLFKYQGCVYVAWFGLTEGISDWLKAPEKLYLGIDKQVEIMVDVSTTQPDVMTGLPVQIMTKQPQMQWQPAEITQYPVALLPYRESEEPTLKEYKGRCFLDENKQEAATSIMSALVNGLNRASNVFGAPKNDDGTGASLKELADVKLKNGTVLSKPFDFWSPPYPDPMMVRFLQYLDVQNSQETNQVNFAAMNREDSRKTAEEIKTSTQQQALLNGVQLTLFSTFVRTITSFQWLIVQSQALQSKIDFLLVEQQIPKMNPVGEPLIGLDGQPVIETRYVNNVELISLEYDVRAAGDVDVVQRQEKIQQMKQDWPVVANTPLAIRFLADLMKLEYPDTGEAYAQEIMQIPAIQQCQAQVQALGTILEGVIQQHPEIVKSLPPQDQQALQQILSSIPKQQPNAKQQPPKQ